MADKTPNRIKALYKETVIPALIKKFNYKNVNQVPKLVKITINSGLGDVKDNNKSVQVAQEELKQISGQKPILTQAIYKAFDYADEREKQMSRYVGRIYSYFSA